MWDVWFDGQIVNSKIEHLSNIDKIELNTWIVVAKTVSFVFNCILSAFKYLEWMNSECESEFWELRMNADVKKEWKYVGGGSCRNK